jgi:GTP cyclohydrolase FolE2
MAVNAPHRIGLPDIQGQIDGRGIAIDEVGIKGVRHPMSILSGGESVPTVATLSMTVALPAIAKGTHMSRFVEVLEEQVRPLDPARFRDMLRAMIDRLDARSGTVEMSFPYFVTKAAPVSGVKSRLDYEVTWRGTVGADGACSFRMRVVVPATSLWRHGHRGARRHRGVERVVRGLRAPEARGREVRHRDGLRQSEVRRGPGPRLRCGAGS